MPAPLIWNRKPLPQNRFAPLPLTAIRVKGWLEEQIAQEQDGSLRDQLQKACLLYDAAAMDTVQAAFGKMLLQKDEPDAEGIRALLAYHAVSADKAVPLFLLRYARDLRERIQAGATLTAKQAASVSDIVHAGLWLYNMTGQRGLLSFCEFMKAQAPDWMSTFHIFPHTKAITDVPDMDTDMYWRMHGQAIAASLKMPALQSLFEGGMKNETAFSVGWEKLMRYHGTANGLYTAGPLLAGRNPSAGTAKEVVAELLDTFHTVLWATGDPLAGDIWEGIFYNTLPVAQGNQSANQLMPHFGTSPCGLSRAAQSLWMATGDGGLAGIGYAPCEVRWRLDGKPVRLEVETNYPYEETVMIRINTKEAFAFPLKLRIPAWAEGATVTLPDGEGLDGKPGTFISVERTWKDGDVVILTLPMAVKTAALFHQTAGVSRGPLAYALPVETGTSWNIALLPDAGFRLVDEAGIPTLLARAVALPSWERSGDVPASPPVAPKVSVDAAQDVKLIPYGLTKARIAQFPVASE